MVPCDTTHKDRVASRLVKGTSLDETCSLCSGDECSRFQALTSRLVSSPNSDSQLESTRLLVELAMHVGAEGAALLHNERLGRTISSSIRYRVNGSLRPTASFVDRSTQGNGYIGCRPLGRSRCALLQKMVGTDHSSVSARVQTPDCPRAECTERH